MFDCRGRQRLGQGISDHIRYRTIDKAKFVILDDPVNEVETYINVLGSGVVLMIWHECDS